ncbi:MAG: galactose mutarotase [Negativicutes bacterium]|nr:galactose mutarotase [Negativicutes bacterium]
MRKTLPLLILAALFFAIIGQSQFVLAADAAKANYVELNRAAFQKVIDGKQVDLYTLQNKNGMVAKITNYGGKIVQLLVPDKNGQLGDVVLGYDSLDQTMKGQASMGCIVGRYANRIGKGQFNLFGVDYQLTINNGPNHLHGGTKGSRFVVFDAIQIDEKTLQLNYYFKDGEEGYPGNCSLKAVYSLTDDNQLKITYDAVTDSPTIVNFTNHAFWNLAGEGRGDILNHVLILNADNFTPVDGTLITTGEIRSVKGTPLDFTSGQKIGARINDSYEQLKYGPGYDFNWVLNKMGKEMSFAARVYEPTSGRVMEIYTTEPGIQFYSGNFLTGKAPMDIGKGGKPYVYRGAFCLETQHYPDSPSKPNFPTTVLMPGEWFSSTTIYQFSVQK